MRYLNFEYGKIYPKRGNLFNYYPYRDYVIADYDKRYNINYKTFQTEYLDQYKDTSQYKDFLLIQEEKERQNERENRERASFEKANPGLKYVSERDLKELKIYNADFNRGRTYIPNTGYDEQSVRAMSERPDVKERLMFKTD